MIDKKIGFWQTGQGHYFDSEILIVASFDDVLVNQTTKR